MGVRRKRTAEGLIEEFQAVNLGSWAKHDAEAKRDGSWKDMTAFDDPRDTGTFDGNIAVD